MQKREGIQNLEIKYNPVGAPNSIPIWRLDPKTNGADEDTWIMGQVEVDGDMELGDKYTVSATVVHT